MTCHHRAADPDCSSNKMHQESMRKAIQAEMTPDASKYEILDVESVGAHLILRVRYPNCSKCAYEGVKIMVFLNVPIKDALKWRLIDPHFRDEKKVRSSQEAPSPDARFPASDQGWQDAIEYARVRL